MTTDTASVNKLAVAGLLVVMFLAAIDATIVGTAMPRVIAAIGGMHLYPWAFSSFMLTSTIATPFFGKFADLYGVRRCMFVAVALFLLGSGLCGLATTMEQLVGYRALQGVGAGGVLTLTFIAFGTLFPPEKRGKAQGLLSMVWGVSSLLGPLTGGLMVAHLPWQWIFWINLPVGAVATAMIFATFPRHVAPYRPHVIDWAGASLLVVGLTALMLALMAQEPLFMLGYPVGLIALGVFVMRQLRSPDPLVPLSPFRNRLFAVSTALGFGTTLTMFAALNYMPLFVQGAMGRSAPEAGLVLTPMMVAWPIASAAAGWVLNRVGFRKIVVLGALFMAAGYALLAWPAFKESLWLLAAQAALLGAGMGLLTSTTLVAAQVSVPPRQIGTASSTLSLCRNIGGAIGLNMLGAMQLWVFNQRLREDGRALTEAQVAQLENPQAVLEQAGSLDPAVWQAFSQALAQSLHAIFGLSLVIALLVLAAAWIMPGLTPKQAAEQAQ